jgi:hypothetical protein
MFEHPETASFPLALYLSIGKIINRENCPIARAADRGKGNKSRSGMEILCGRE